MNSKFKAIDSIVALKDDDGQVTSDSASTCERLNMYFHSVFEPQAPPQSSNSSAENDDHRADEMSWETNSQVTIDLVKSKLEELDVQKTPGVDKVAGIVVK